MAEEDLVEGAEDIAEEDVQDNGTAAAATLKTHWSKSEALASAMSGLGKMQQPELMDFIKKNMEFIANPNLGAGAPDASEKNKASIGMKPSGASPGQPPLASIQAVKEDLSTILKEENLSETFVEKALVLFEAAVNARVILEAARIEDEYAERLDTEIDDVIQKLDSYVDHAAREFFTENQIAIENSLRVDLMEEFIDGLRDLFQKHYVEVPDDRVDVVSALADRVDELEEQLNARTEELIAVREEVAAAIASRVFAEATEGMTDVDAAKLRDLCETVEFDGDEERLRHSIDLVRDAHFKKEEKKEKGRAPDELLEGETVTVQVVEKDGTLIAEEANVPPEVRSYYDAVSRTVGRKTV